MLAAMRTLLAVLLAAPAIGCSSSSASSSPADASTEVATEGGTGLGGYDPNPFGGSRPVKLYVPTGYSASTPAPLVILLHGYSANGAEEDLYLDLHATAEADSVLYAHPDGTLDIKGNRFWNATDACCDFYGVTVDDVAYLTSLVTEIETRYSVDKKRIYFMGHSNGAFMSYRMACDRAEMVAAIASLAGATWLDTSRCKPSQPVSVVEIHGNADQVVLYDGGTTNTDSIFDGGTITGGGQYPSATTTVADWVSYDGCSTTANTSSPSLDIVAGMSTTDTRYKSGCRSGSEVDLWTIQGGSHIPGIAASFGPDAFKFLLAHPKP
jgi:polyhydroxybutyrate depolymerase